MSGRPPLVFSSLLADNAEPLFADLAGYLATRLVRPVELAGGPWSARRRLIADGAAHLAALCGALVVFDDELSEILEPVAAPVCAGSDGREGAVYFTDVVVVADHPARRFEELRGCAWAYNEPASHSGYHVVRAHLAELGEAGGFFGSAVSAGSHQAALERVLDGRADAAPIDSYVLARARAARPAVDRELRVVARLGPSPAPPLAVARSLPAALRQRIGELLTAMHEEPEGARLLRAHLLERFAPAGPADYAPIRAMAAAGEGIELT